MQTIEEILKIIKEKNLNVADISRRTGIPGTRIYKWLDGKGNPKVVDSGKILDWAANNLEVVPNSVQTNESLAQPDASIPEPTPMQILAVLADAFKAQAEMMRNIESKMAQETTQAIIQEAVKKLDDKAKEIGTNLIRTLTVVESARIVQDRSQIELLDHLRKLKAGKDLPSQDEGKRSRQKNGDGQRRGKSPA